MAYTNILQKFPLKNLIWLFEYNDKWQKLKIALLYCSVLKGMTRLFDC